MFDNFQEGFGTVSRETLDTLLKALSAGTYNAAPNTLTNGAALQVESLDSSLKSVTFEDKHLKLWPTISKDKAYNITEEYNRQTSYGESSNGGFFDANSGTAPSEQTSAYNRQIQEIKYLGTTRIVTHPLTLVKPAHGPVIAREIRNGTMYILQNLERQLYSANDFFESATATFTGAASDVHAASAKFNGLGQQIRVGDSDSKAQYTGWEAYGGTNSVVRDLNGAALAEEDLEELAVKVLENHGMPSDLHIDHKTYADLNKLFYPKERNITGQFNGQAGTPLQTFNSIAGPLKVTGNTFLRPKDAPLAVAETGAPAAPVNSASGVEADTSSELGDATYHYKVSAVNNAGESLPTANRSQAVTSGNRVTLTIDAGTTGALYYAVFRGTASTGPWKFIGYVKDSNGTVGGGGATFRDAGHKNPGTATGFLLTMDADNLIWKQLAPLMKMDLAVTGPAFRWMQLLYGTPIVFRPLYHGLFENVGRAS